jgi:hypothetical protein
MVRQTEIAGVPDIPQRKASTRVNKWDWRKVLSELGDVPAIKVDFETEEMAKRGQNSVVAWWHYNSEGRVLRTHVEGKYLTIWIVKREK